MKSDPFWVDSFIYQTEDLEKDATDYLNTQIPSLSEESILRTIEDLKHYQKLGYRKFYQAITYCGLFGKYDEKNCFAVCLLCKQPLLATNEKKCNAPVLDIIDPQGTLDPVIVFVTCDNCHQRLETAEVDGHYSRNDLNIIRKEHAFILYSEQTDGL